MVTLTPDAARVLGTLVEKAQTTPAQYPLTLNALVNGVNQRSNRDPVVSLTEEQVFDAVMVLRSHRLANEVDLAGSRVAKYRHVAREALGVDTPQLCIMTELLLRGPQTAAELRARASRMAPLDAPGAAEAALDALMVRPEPLVRELPPIPGTRATRFAQLLCPNLHRLDAAPSAGGEPVRSTGGIRGERRAPPSGSSPSADERLDRLEAEVAGLTRAVRALAAALGEADPLGADSK